MIFDIYQSHVCNQSTEFVLKNGDATYGMVSFERTTENKGTWRGNLLGLSFQLDVNVETPFTSGSVNSYLESGKKSYYGQIYSAEFRHKSSEKYICTFLEDEQVAYTMYLTNPDGKKLICPVFIGEERVALLEQTDDLESHLLSFRIYANTRFESFVVLQMLCNIYHDILHSKSYKTMSSINEMHDESYKDEIMLHNRV